MEYIYSHQRWDFPKFFANLGCYKKKRSLEPDPWGSMSGGAAASLPFLMAVVVFQALPAVV
jgi:hypothetical protein